MAKTFYITTPIFYPNAKLHVGHAYTTTVSDILARYQRLAGNEVYFLTGSDENTQKMIDAARKEGKDPAVFLDEIVDKFASLFGELNISYDQFIRTTDQQKHWPGAQALWQKLVAADDIYKKEYEGLYCVGHEAFATEKDLVDGKCPDHGVEPQFLKEENYFFRLSKYASVIKEKIESDELRVVPESRKNEVLSLINEGLQDVSFSRPRKADWPQSLGIPVPGDDSQVMYVWCDALSNYITALGYGQEGELFAKFWPAQVHVMGKDILRFHAAIWPAMLLSAGVPLPKSLLVHGFITSGGKKMSKTLGNVIDPEELLAEYGTDAVRYYLARHISPFEDGDITREAFKDVYNADLANGLGNLVRRVLTLARNNNVELEMHERKSFDKIVSGNDKIYQAFAEALSDFRIDKALDRIFSKEIDGAIGWMDQSIAQKRPFELIKTDPIQGKKEIWQLLKDLWDIAVLIEPFMPNASLEIKNAIEGKTDIPTLFPRKD